MFSLDFPKKNGHFVNSPLDTVDTGCNGGSLGAPELPLQAPQKARRTLPGRAIAQGFGLAEVLQWDQHDGNVNKTTPRKWENDLNIQHKINSNYTLMYYIELLYYKYMYISTIGYAFHFVSAQQPECILI